MEERSFFSNQMTKLSLDGHPRAFSGTIQFTVDEAHVIIGSQTIPYHRVMTCSYKSADLYLTFVDDTDRLREIHLGYRPFFSWNAAEKVVLVSQYIGKKIKEARQGNPPSTRIVGADWRPGPDGSFRIVVYSSKIAFPDRCPKCFGHVSDFTTLQRSSGQFLGVAFQHVTAKLKVPVCSLHKGWEPGIRFVGISTEEMEFEFEFDLKDYAEAFYKLNSGR
jgi:hypothetical protein